MEQSVPVLIIKNVYIIYVNYKIPGRGNKKQK